MKLFHYTGSAIVHLTPFLLIASFLVSCVERDKLPDEPVINSIEYLEDTRQLVVTFTDGDGNFGLHDNETQPPYQPYLDTVSMEPNPYHYNYWLDYYKKDENGQWLLVELPGNANFRIPFLTPEGQDKQLRVKITNDLGTEIPLPPFIVEGDTMKFAVTLIDRALNHSNVAETPPFIAPPKQ